MKERPILFSGPMVRAILAGRKTQTRRVMKPQPTLTREQAIAKYGKRGTFALEIGFDGVRCPFGVPGDRLWVRETTIISPPEWGDVGVPGFVLDNENRKRGVQYLATAPDREAADDFRLKATPSIFMPRWASRITLDVTGVRVERLQDISLDDCSAEGVEFPENARSVANFVHLWESINGAGSWKQDPWVWIVEFKRAEAKSEAA